MNATGVPFHPLADMLPLLEGAEFDALVEDIRVNGQIEPIVLHQGKILDGRNRYRACKKAGIEPHFEKYEGDDPVGFVISLNLKRRHLNESQRAMVAANLATMRRGERTDIVENSTMSAQHAADLLNVDRKSVFAAKAVRASDNPTLIAAVEQGKIAVSAAANLTKQPREFQNAIVAKVEAGAKLTEAQRQARKEAIPDKVAALPRGQYRVIYADPPWAYNDARQMPDSRAFTGALHHYSTMSLDELKALDVLRMAAPDCVLFCWATSPLLPDALDVVTSWGFTYKTFFVWDKGHGAFGHYHDADAELLIVATRGSCTPDIDKKEKQVQRFHRAEHSRKPEEWRALIDRLYPHGPRIELFRRGAAPRGWEIWGAEAENAA